MRATGQPLHFVGIVLGGWITMRALVLAASVGQASGGPTIATPPDIWPMGAPSRLRTLAAMLVGPETDSVATPMPLAPSTVQFARLARPALAKASGPHASGGGGWSTAVADSMLGAQMAFVHAPRAGLSLASYAPGVGLSPREGGVPDPTVAPPVAGASRWSGAAWILWRGQGGDTSLVSAGRLGGSQAGIRADYAFAPGSSLRPSLYGRASGALAAPVAAEVAAGVAIRPPAPLPLTLAIERRQAVSPGGRNDFAFVAATGIDRRAVGGGFRLDGYGQAGFVGLAHPDAFVDGRLTLDHRVAHTGSRNGDADDGAVALGASVSGGAQPGAARLDIGPEASVRLRAGRTFLRLGAEWREKIAGDALPSSGAALTLGAGF